MRLSLRVAFTTLVLTMTGALAACGSPPASSRSSTPRASSTPHGTAFDVTAYGARGDGTSDNTMAFAGAISAAQSAGGGTVYVPAGKYLFSTRHTPYPGSVAIEGTVPITLQGAGRDLTTLIQGSADKNLVNVRVDGTVVEDITLDAQTHEGAAAIVVVANHTTLEHTRVLGGSHHFAIYYAGPQGASPGAPVYNVGNTGNVTHRGSRLALYIDRSTTVSGYRYTPGPQPCGARNGFWLTPPSADITINDFVSSGEGGKIGVISPQHAGRVATNITIRGLTMTRPGYQLTIGDVRNLVLQDCNLGADSIVVATQLVAQGTVSGCTFAQLVRHNAPAAQVSITVSG
jgi:hypothetical protein